MAKSSIMTTGWWKETEGYLSRWKTLIRSVERQTGPVIRNKEGWKRRDVRADCQSPAAVNARDNDTGEKTAKEDSALGFNLIKGLETILTATSLLTISDQNL